MDYTKGEWKVDHKDIIDNSGRSLAQLIDGSYEEIEANARLIAAAPDMYEALLSALGSLIALGIKDRTWGKGILDNIQKALAKAEGK